MAALAVVLMLDATSSIVPSVGASMTKLRFSVMIGGPLICDRRYPAPLTSETSSRDLEPVAL